MGNVTSSKKILVSPSILSADFANLEQEIRKVVSAGADWIHVDVMDGHFVPNITIGAPVVASLKKKCAVPLDVHLMIENPEKYIEDFVGAGAAILTIHVESTKNPSQVLKKIRDLGARPGITLKPGTPIEEIFPYLDKVDLVLVMTVNPGFSGQSFMPEQVDKIRKVHQQILARRLSVHIEVDGGLNEKTVVECINAGADVIVAGNFVFKNDYEKSIASLKGGRTRLSHG